LFPSNNLTFHTFHPHHILNDSSSYSFNSHNVFSRLCKVLKTFNLWLAPADKTRIITICPRYIFEKEVSIHLHDTDTYTEITEEEFNHTTNLQLQTIREAIIFYKNPLLLPNERRDKYLYFLPKVHKPLSEWRENYHPKMRPILSTSGTLMQPLERHLLPTLQRLETTFSTITVSSLAVSHHISQFNRTVNLTGKALLATIDVESLYTKIPLDKLWDIIVKLMENSIPNETERHYYLHFLSIIIHHNTFKVNQRYYHQKTGVPMGGILSGVLANLYLAYLEQQVLYSHPIYSDYLYIFQRYVDDILIVSTLNEIELNEFINILSNSYNLRLTSTSNSHNINFLDMTIKSVNNQLFIQPFSKNTLLYPLPSFIGRRNYQRDLNIIKSQILRTYRFSTDNSYFSSSLHFYLRFFTTHDYHKMLKKAILNFLKPIRNNIGWNSTIPLCGTCHNILSKKNIHVDKVCKVDSHYFGIKSPLNCQTRNIHVIHNTNNNITIQLVNSLHHFISCSNSTTSTIVPIGHLKLRSLHNILRKSPSIFYPHRAQILKMKIQLPCFVHPVVRRPSEIYGVPCLSKKHRNIGNLFSDYKKVCQ
jgi:hypothetical protein